MNRRERPSATTGGTGKKPRAAAYLLGVCILLAVCIGLWFLPVSTLNGGADRDSTGRSANLGNRHVMSREDDPEKPDLQSEKDLGSQDMRLLVLKLPEINP